jgi:hypothetical protein
MKASPNVAPHQHKRSICWRNFPLAHWCAIIAAPAIPFENVTQIIQQWRD